MRRILATLAVTGLLITGCSNVSAPTTVRLIAHDYFAVSAPLVAQFEKLTGYKLEVIKAGDSGKLVAGAVLAAGNPTADVLFGIDNTMLSKALDAGVFEPYNSPAAAALRSELAATSAGGLVTPVDYGDVCINIDDAYFASRRIPPPTELADLAKPQYKDLLVVEDPAASSPGLAFMLATKVQFGADWLDFWTSLKANGVKVAGSWDDAYYSDFTKGGGNGAYPLVVSYATSPPAEIVYASEPKPTTASTSSMTNGCFRQIEYAAVLAGAANPEGARAVIDWLLSPEVQADVPLSMFVFPSVQGVWLPEVFTKFAGQVNAPLTMSSSEIAAGVDAWLSAWDGAMRS